ncbi:MAG: TonB family protein [Burkholderiaceae bacterium]|nr:TonB family protein [Burkholderiaceae bacterium]
MDASRLSAAGGALALHALVIAGVLALAVAPPATRPLEPVQVVLLVPPEPLPVARQPAPPAREPDAAQPAAEPLRSPPTEVKPPPKTARARPRPAPPPEAAPAPAAPAAPVVQPAPAPAQASPPPTAITAAPAAGPADVAPARGHAQAPSIAARSAGASTAPQARSAPHVDATWSGNTPPPYPGMARRMGDQGEVRLDVHVGVDGRVTEVRLRQSSGSTLLDRTAIETVKKWRFKPATVDGQPVAEWYHDWRWVFRLEG